jgi:hypothetical protein
VDGTISYLNTDLDLISSDELTALAAVFESRGVFPLHVMRRDDGLWYATFETEDQHTEPEPNIAAMVVVVESLEEPHRSTWLGCTRREFNIGYDCGARAVGVQPGVVEWVVGSHCRRGRIAASHAVPGPRTEPARQVAARDRRDMTTFSGL